MQRGKYVILLIFAVAIAMSGYAWWYQYKMGRRTSAFWGPAGVVLIQYAPQVEFVPLFPTRPDRPDQESVENSLNIGGVEFWLDEPLDVTHSRGLVHVRHALVDDLSIDWDATALESKQWDFLLRIRDGEQHVTVAIDTESGQLYYVEGSRLAQLIPNIAAAMRQKRDDWEKLAAAKQSR